MTAAQLVGGALILALFLAIAAVMVRDMGWRVALAAWASGLAGTAVLTIGAALLSGDLG